MRGGNKVGCSEVGEEARFEADDIFGEFRVGKFFEEYSGDIGERMQY